jgi:hypothetical protein
MKEGKHEVSRDGKTLGYFSFRDMHVALASGRLLYTDYYYQADKERWEQLSVQFPAPSKSGEDRNRGSEVPTLATNPPYRRTETVSNQAERVSPLPKMDQSIPRPNGKYTCQCCLTAFDKPSDLSPMTLVGSLLSPIGLLLMMPDGKYWNILGLGLLAYGSALFVAGSLASPRCPSCHSPNIKNNLA